jgi:TonB family protein
MAKIVKYCGACEESFAEKFGFCPNCGGSLAAYEMNPIAEVKKPEAAGTNLFAAPAEPAVLKQDSEIVAAHAEPRTDPAVQSTYTPYEAPATFAAAAPAQSSHRSEPVAVGYRGASEDVFADDDGLYHATVIEERDLSKRGLFVLGAMALVLTLVASGVIYSLFNHNLQVGAFSDDDLLTYVNVDDTPAQTEETPVKKNNDKGGGGGGSGKEEKDPVSQGRLANQSPDPVRLPTSHAELRDADLKLDPATTQGNRVFKSDDNKYGDPNSKFNGSSDGTGRGGGMGTGDGTGQGSGRGSGQGSGIGSGSGGGDGNGNGNGKGDGDNGADKIPPKKVKEQPTGVTEAIKIISKPRAGYTDEARTNNVTGTVRLRVTFLSSGQVGSIAPISGLGFGLTEKAIAAARSIRFEPAKVNGVPQTVTKQIEYSFTIY